MRKWLSGAGRNLPLFLLVLILAAGAIGCGPSKKQYAINEALLMDQTRLLENEVYQTRFALQQTMRENEILRKELLDLKGGSNDPEPTRNKTARRVPSDVLPMTARTDRNVEELPQNVVSPRKPAVPVQPVGTKTTLTPSANAPVLTIPSASNSPIVNPVYRQNGHAPVINQTGYSGGARVNQPPEWGPIER